jgi:hypothetical protein
MNQPPQELHLDGHDVAGSRLGEGWSQRIAAQRP